MVAIVPLLLKRNSGALQERKQHAPYLYAIRTLVRSSIFILSFPVVVLGACLVRIFILPVSKIVVHGEYARQQMVRRVIGSLLRIFFWILARLGIVAVEVRGNPESLPSKSLIVANHPSLLDALVLFACVPDVVCIAKPAIFSWPVFGSIAGAAGFISTGDIQGVLEGSDHALRSGSRLLIFPEGTRSVGGRKLGDFAKLGAGIAVRCRVPVVPVVIRCDPPCLYRGQSLRELLGRRFEFTVTLCDSWGPFEADESVAGQRELRAEITRKLYDFFDEQVYG